MKPNLLDLGEITDLTLTHYNERAKAFWTGTKDHDVGQNIAALLQYIKAVPPFNLLDFGCGPGRDLKVFAELGHIATGLEGAMTFVEMARSHSGCEVWHQDFLRLDLPDGYFDGIFANASLFHVPTSELSRVLKELWATLKPDGVLFSSNPRGNNEEGWNQGRYGVYHHIESWRHYLANAGFVEITHYYRPAGLPFEQQSWLASVWRKVTALR
ncbi:bifunctional 2-polyprenyl-6-hydroxyphenol methylase/3-demethylubiquinol 3-O-methyltransferase UbiG [Nitrosospira sp. Nsp1]|uniref:class I SAM-dependent methyltransferase n=1 Tax=Nitrosospira sp. Nsp1 TaxID=136547 RepID=UPI00088F4E7C|nr:class I SAM-dependent methyltransferase [Nitrosospira sp. Nsp1]SCX38897.1 Methyltransferase domain-containing protein [Nitrosospira sp. Nsp1]